MPFTFLSHQAPVLPLKLARPRWFSGTALAIGSMAPDLGYFVWGQWVRPFTHSLVGQLVFCLPLTLLLTWLVRRLLARPVALHLPDAGPFRLREYRLLEEGEPKGYWRRAVGSALVGTFSHVGWDSFTHHSGWSARQLGYADMMVLLGDSPVPLYKLLQHSGTLLGGALSLWVLYRIGRDRLLARWYPEAAREPVPEVTRASAFALWLPALGGALLGLASALLSGPLLEEVDAPALARVCFPAVGAGFAGLCAGCLFAGRRMRGDGETGRP